MTEQTLKIGIFGIGYVGAVSAACFAKEGHDVVCVDTNPDKVDLINRGEAPIIEAGLAELTASVVQAGKLRASVAVRDAVVDRDIVVICVGTPSRTNGDLDLTYVKRVCEEIGSALKEHKGYCSVILRSTVLPGTMRGLVIPTLEQGSGLRAGEDFGVLFYPEFLREGSAIKDFNDPGTMVLAGTDSKCIEIAARLNPTPEQPHIEVEFESAEMVKYTNNSWHALKVVFANEIGSVARAVGVDGQEIMNILCQDKKLNISEAYMKPGFAFGGSCLPKDLRALGYKSRSLDLDLPLLNSILPGNQSHLDRALRIITNLGSRRIGLLGLSFKAGTDDVRESPLVAVVEYLLGKGYEIKIFDRIINLSQLVGANRAFMLERLPHISKLLVNDVDEVLSHAETLVVGNSDEANRAALENVKPHHTVVDLVRLGRPRDEGGYEGICW